MRISYLPALRALLAVNRREPSKAIELLKAPAHTSWVITRRIGWVRRVPLSDLRARHRLSRRAPGRATPRENSRRFSITAVLSSAIQLAHWRTFNSGERSRSREHGPKRRAPTRFPHALERCRPRNPDLEGSPRRIRQIAVNERPPSDVLSHLARSSRHSPHPR